MTKEFSGLEKKRFRSIRYLLILQTLILVFYVLWSAIQKIAFALDS